MDPGDRQRLVAALNRLAGEIDYQVGRAVRPFPLEGWVLVVVTEDGRHHRVDVIDGKMGTPERVRWALEHAASTTERKVD